MARALVRDPAILILDEAGSALDPKTEAAIAETVKRLARHRTVVSVTHCMESIAHADLVLVMHRGRIVESSTPLDLD